mmetsp:Transcript_84475/g.149499  ORF Transcript_84475/g.149499 Transcript_84475/m.149499 type:complete len:332 (-) Transcript_84475:635-1630(-)
MERRIRYPDTDFKRLVLEGDLLSLQKELQRGQDPSVCVRIVEESSQQRPVSALEHAIVGGHHDMTLLLLCYGADVKFTRFSYVVFHVGHPPALANIVDVPQPVDNSDDEEDNNDHDDGPPPLVDDHDDGPVPLAESSGEEDDDGPPPLVDSSGEEDEVLFRDAWPVGERAIVEQEIPAGAAGLIHFDGNRPHGLIHFDGSRPHMALPYRPYRNEDPRMMLPQKDAGWFVRLEELCPEGHPSRRLLKVLEAVCCNGTIQACYPDLLDSTRKTISSDLFLDYHWKQHVLSLCLRRTGLPLSPSHIILTYVFLDNFVALCNEDHWEAVLSQRQI